VQNGTPLNALQELGGWKSLEMVQRYAHLAPSHLASFANNLSKMVDTDINTVNNVPRDNSEDDGYESTNELSEST
jgi:hypothetical protein